METQETMKNDRKEIKRERVTAASIMTEANKCRQNVDKCLKALESRDWNRNRQDQATDPDRPIPDHPTTADYGLELKATAKAMRELSHHFLRWGDYLTRDEVIIEGQDERVKNHVSIIQNNVDAAQWMSIQLSHLQKLAVPLSRPGDIDVLGNNQKLNKK